MAEMTRQEFLARYRSRDVNGPLRVRVRTEHTHVDSEFTVIVEGHVGNVYMDGDHHGTTTVRACVGGDGRHGDGIWVAAFLGSETTALGLSKHLKVTVEEI